jgi:PBSX family phage terminase large subunit
VNTATVANRWGDLTTPTHPRWQTDPATERLTFHDAQEPFLHADARYYNFTSGIGAGKTVAGIIRAAANVERWNAGETGMILAPTVPALKNVILPELRKWGFLAEWEYRGPGSEEPGLHAPNGARILLESADNRRKIERLRGPSIAWFWIDEAAQVPKRAWDILIGRLRTGQYRNGFITTTPKGKNWVYHRFHPDGDRRVDDVTNVLGVATHENPHLPEDYREDIVEEYDGRFYQQEVEGAFVGFEGLVYPWFTDTHVIDARVDEWDRIVYGVDRGFSNPSVALAVAMRGDQPVVLDEVYQSRLTDDDLAEELLELYEVYGRGTVYCDPSEPGSIEALRRKGVDAIPAENDVEPGIKAVTSKQDSLRIHERCQNTINEFGMYQYRDGGESDKVRKENDHAMDALRYAVYSAGSGGSVATARASFGDGTTGDATPDAATDGTTVGDVLPSPDQLGR